MPMRPLRGTGAAGAPRLASAGRAARRFAAAGALLGLLAALVTFAPAAWLASAVASATGQRLLLADARGSVWRGSAVPVLTGGPGSRDASALPGRLQWAVGIDAGGLRLAAEQPCCINGTLVLRVQPGIGRLKVLLPAAAGTVGQWPAAWLAGLGTPFNTLRLGGTLALASSGGLAVEMAQGRWLLAGDAELALNGMSSQVSTLPLLGSYSLRLAGGDIAQLALSTREGPLRLAGTGHWSASGLRFRGDARADPGTENALNNLLNIIGRRQGAAAVLSIG